jgi:RHS repeat-associated protein
MMSTHAADASGTIGFLLDGAIDGATYALDIETRSGYHHLVTGIVPDASGAFAVAELEFSAGETNFVRVRGEGAHETPYSAPVSVMWDDTVVPSSQNQIRAINVSRSATDIEIQWALGTDYGDGTKLYFRRPDGTVLALTPTALPPGMTSLVMSAQSLSVDCGSVFGTQLNLQTGLETGPTPDTEMGSVGGGSGGDECEDAPGPPAPQPTDTFVDQFHHRDHLGSLRVVTDAAGHKVDAMDFFAFGMTIGGGGESTRGFTGHEKDDGPDLLYPLARYKEASTARFTSVDPVTNPGALTSPQIWNRFSYTGNSPVSRVDPDGKDWFRLTDRWEWHIGSSYIDKDGNSHQGYDHLLVVEESTTENGKATFKLTLYEQNKVVMTGTASSGGNGGERIPAGNYLIRTDIRDEQGPNQINADSLA